MTDWKAFIPPIAAQRNRAQIERDAWREEAELLALALLKADPGNIALAAYEAFKTGFYDREGMTWRCQCGRENQIVTSPVPVRCACGAKVPRDPTIVTH